MNWGHKITIAIVLFMSFILYMVVQASMKSVDLEAEDYYSQGISFQDLMEAKANAAEFESQLIVKQEGENLTITYPEALIGTSVEGTLNFFKPDNSNLDKELEMKVGEGAQIIPLKELSKGVYVLKFSWTASGKEFYMEKALNIQ